MAAYRQQVVWWPAHLLPAALLVHQRRVALLVHLPQEVLPECQRRVV
jgi:hypothetical protein